MLPGSELDDYRRKEREEGARARAESSMIDDESSDEEMPEVAAATSGRGPVGGGGSVGVGGSAGIRVKHDIYMRTATSSAPSSQTPHQTGFFKSVKTKYPMFPFHEERVRT